jgi:hypothetical protein
MDRVKPRPLFLADINESAEGHGRVGVNGIRRIFKWGVGEDHVASSVHQALACPGSASRGQPGSRSPDNARIQDRALEAPWTTSTDGSKGGLKLELLKTYKRQPTIEKRFSQLNTDFEVAPVYLNAVHRIQALLSMDFFVLLIEALLEREPRGGMERTGIESLPLYPEGRPCCWPTARRLLDLFEPVQRHTLTQAKRPAEVLVTRPDSRPTPTPQPARAHTKALRPMTCPAQEIPRQSNPDVWKEWSNSASLMRKGARPASICRR